MAKKAFLKNPLFVGLLILFLLAICWFMRPTEGLEEAYNYDGFRGLLIFTLSKDCTKCDETKAAFAEVSAAKADKVKIVDLSANAPDEVIAKYKLQMDMLPKIFLSYKDGKTEEYTGEMDAQSLMQALKDLNKKDEPTELPPEDPSIPEDFRTQY